MSFKSGFESRERESQFNTAGGSEFQVRGAALLNDCLANDVRRNGMHSSGTDDDRVFIASRFDSGNTLYNSIADDLMRRLQSIQNTAAQLVTK